MKRRVLALFAFSILGTPAALFAAETETFQADYSVSLLGIPIARSSFTSVIGLEAFKVEGSLSSAGLARIFDDTEGTTSVSGRFAGEEVQPESYVVSYTSGKKKKKTAITFKRGDVVATENVPPPKKRSKDWIPVADGHLTSVVDPISATLVRASTPAEVCERTLKVYDGQLRADLKLSPAKKPETDGTVTCRARFVPVSGYRKGHDSLEYLRSKSKIVIEFAPLGKTGVYAPVTASVGTKIGTVYIEARNFEASN